MAGTPIPSWSDFYRITGPAVLEGPEDFLNEAAERSYLMTWLVGGKMNVQGGSEIVEYPMVEDGSSAANTHPGSERTHLQPQVLRTLTAQWRLTEDFMVFNHIIRDLNEGGGGAKGRYQRRKSEQKREEVRVATSLSNKLENDLFAQPDVSTMEGTGANIVNPNSIFVFVNEYGGQNDTTSTIFDTDARYPYGTGLPNGYTTIQGINPTTEKWYRCWQVPYSDDYPTVSTTNAAGHNLFTALSKALNLVKYKPLPWKAGATVNDAANNTDYVIPVSVLGDALVQSIARAGNNFFRTAPGDAFYPNVAFAGIPFVPCSGMDRAEVYPTSGTTAPAVGAGVTEANADNAGPRFPLISRKWMRQIFHEKYAFYMWPSKIPTKQHDTEIIPVSTLHNRVCTSRRKMAMIYPGGADIA